MENDIILKNMKFRIAQNHKIIVFYKTKGRNNDALQ